MYWSVIEQRQKDALLSLQKAEKEPPQGSLKAKHSSAQQNLSANLQEGSGRVRGAFDRCGHNGECWFESRIGEKASINQSLLENMYCTRISTIYCQIAFYSSLVLFVCVCVFVSKITSLHVLTTHLTIELYPQSNKINFAKSPQIKNYTNYTLGLGKKFKNKKRNISLI